MSFKKYLKSLLKMTISSSLTLALLVCILVLLVGETSVEGNIELEIERIDGLWLLLGLPAIAIILSTVLSPVSFFLHRLISRREARSTSSN